MRTITEVPDLVEHIARRDGQHCHYCGCDMVAEGVKVRVDHLHPLSKGGCPHDEGNVVLACDPCNREKLGKWGAELVGTKFEKALAPRDSNPEVRVDIELYTTKARKCRDGICRWLGCENDGEGQTYCPKHRKAQSEYNARPEVKAKKAEYMAGYLPEYYDENREAILAYQAEYYAENREHILAYRAEYRAENREALSTKEANRRQAHRDAGICLQCKCVKGHNATKDLCRPCANLQNMQNRRLRATGVPRCADPIDLSPKGAEAFKAQRMEAVNGQGI